MDYRFFYRRTLPHYQPPYATVFVTFRLAGSIPMNVLRQLAEARDRVVTAIRHQAESVERERELYAANIRAFTRWDETLDGTASGPRWLEQANIARLVMDNLHFHAGRKYDLVSYCIMPNHVHLIMAPLKKGDGGFHSLASIMLSLKGYTAAQANKALGRRGPFWQQESYDHVVRDAGEGRRIIEYVLNNPVKAGLVNEWQDWPWSFVCETATAGR